MIFAEIENEVCVNILEFENLQEAKKFNTLLIELPEGFGIGDFYQNEIWTTKKDKIETQIQQIDLALENIDKQGVTRHLENQIEASKTFDFLYESTKQLILKKQELRKQREQLLQR